MNDQGNLMTISEAAERSACSSKTIRRAIDAGQLAAVRLGKSARSDRIHPVDLDVWWQRSRHTPAFHTIKSARVAPPLAPSADERIALLLAPKRHRTLPATKYQRRPK